MTSTATSLINSQINEVNKNPPQEFSQNENSSNHISIQQLSKAISRTYSHQENNDLALFQEIEDPGNINWSEQIKQIPIACDKFSTQNESEIFYQNHETILQILKIKKCTIISFSNSGIVEGSVILTERGNAVEVEYGKNPRVRKGGIGEYMLLTLMENYHVFSLPKTVSSLYAEVVLLDNKFNFGSYITLLRSGFFPKKRSCGDGIQFVTSDPSSELLPEILATFQEYENVSKAHAHAKGLYKKTAVSSASQSSASSNPLFSGSETLESLQENIIKDLFMKKQQAAEAFEKVCLSCAPFELPQIQESALEEQPKTPPTALESSDSLSEELALFASLDSPFD